MSQDLENKKLMNSLKRQEINKVDGYYPEAEIVEFDLLQDDRKVGIKKTLPLRIKEEWFLLKYPDGAIRFKILNQDLNYVKVTCYLYRNYKDDAAHFLRCETAVVAVDRQNPYCINKTEDEVIGVTVNIAKAKAEGYALHKAGFGFQYEMQLFETDEDMSGEKRLVEPEMPIISETPEIDHIIDQKSQEKETAEKEKKEKKSKKPRQSKKGLTQQDTVKAVKQQGNELDSDLISDLENPEKTTLDTSVIPNEEIATPPEDNLLSMLDEISYNDDDVETTLPEEEVKEAAENSVDTSIIMDLEDAMNTTCSAGAFATIGEMYQQNKKLLLWYYDKDETSDKEKVAMRTIIDQDEVLKDAFSKIEE